MTPIKIKTGLISQGVTEVSWTGGNLPDSEYDQFTFYTVLADTELADTGLADTGLADTETPSPCCS